MSEPLRYALMASFFLLPAFFLTGITVGIGQAFLKRGPPQNGVLPLPRFLRNLQYAVTFAGYDFGIWLFWTAFGIGMGSSANDSVWVMTYVYRCLWFTIPLIGLGYLLPGLGGPILIANAFWGSHLLRTIWANKVSFASLDEIFLVSNGVYDLNRTLLAVSGPMLALGLFFLFIAWKSKSFRLVPSDTAPPPLP